MAKHNRTCLSTLYDSCHTSILLFSSCFRKKFYFCIFYFPIGEWADPGGSAIPGQPVARTEQAPIPWPKFKNQFNIQVPQWGTFQILSWKEQILHMILAKRPRSDTLTFGTKIWLDSTRCLEIPWCLCDIDPIVNRNTKLCNAVHKLWILKFG